MDAQIFVILCLVAFLAGNKLGEMFDDRPIEATCTLSVPSPTEGKSDD